MLKEVKGSGMTLGLTNGTDNGCLTSNLNMTTVAQVIQSSGYGINTDTNGTPTNTSIFGHFGVTTDETKSGIVTDISSDVNYIIKY